MAARRGFQSLEFGPSQANDDERPRQRRSSLQRRVLHCALPLTLFGAATYLLVPARRCDCARATTGRLPELHWRLPVGCDFSGFFTEVVAGFLPALAQRPALTVRLLHGRCPDSFLSSQLAPDEARAYRACQLDESIADSRAEGTVRVEHGDPCGMRIWSDETHRPLLVIARSMSEGALPYEQAECINALADEAWVPTAWHVASLRAAGVSVPVRIVPEAVDVRLFAPDASDAFLSDLGSDTDADATEAAAALERDAAGVGASVPAGNACGCAPGAVDVHAAASEARQLSAAQPQPVAAAARSPYVREPSRFAFLSVFKWEVRKGPDVLLASYWRAFADRPHSVVLVLRAWVPPWEEGPETVQERVELAARQFGAPLSQLPPVVVLGAELSRAQLAALYRAVDGFVLPTRGEGWGLPVAEAMATGLPAIVTNYSGPTAFVDNGNARPLPYTRVYSDGLCEPDGAALERLMAELVDDRPRARALGQAARRSMVRRFAPEIVAALIEKRLRDALAHHVGVRS